MTEPSIAGAVLDHVAHAVPRWQDAWSAYAVELGAEWASGGPGPGFAPAQLRFANRARVEVLMPNQVEVNDFLARFLARNGPGAHHLTFKVSDLAAALDEVRRAGFDPVNEDFSDPDWMEAFIHPKQATGVVVQIAQAGSEWANPQPDEYPTGRRQRPSGGPVPPASLVRVTHAVADLDRARALFAGLLDGTVAGEGARPGERWIDVTWPGPLAVRLVTPADGPASPLAAWLEGRAGRVHHLAFEAEEPDGVAGARPARDVPGTDPGVPLWVVEPEDNQGLRLVVTDAGRAPAVP